MKLKGLKLNNFANFSNFEISFNDHITRLVGVNGSGKTKIGLHAIWAVLKGISENDKGGSLIGERFKFIGSKKASADIELTVHDERDGTDIVIKNHITKQSNKITCSPVKDKDWLNDLLSAAFMSAKNFTSIDSKKQALLLGINTAEFDKAIQELKTEYSFINRDIKNFGEFIEVKKVDRVSVSDLSKEKDRIQEYDKQQDQKTNRIEAKRLQINQNKEKMEECVKYIEDAENTLNKIKNEYKSITSYASALQKEYEELPQPEAKKGTEELLAQIVSAEETNKKADEYERYVQISEDKLKKEEQLNGNSTKQQSKIQERLDYIKSFKFEFAGLDVDDNGGLILNGRLINSNYFSTGELEMIVAGLQASLDPELKIRFIEDFDLLDEDNQKKLVDKLLEKGFQVITAEVGKIKKDDCILLRECQEVESYSEDSKENLI